MCRLVPTTESEMLYRFTPSAFVSHELKGCIEVSSYSYVRRGSQSLWQEAIKP